MATAATLAVVGAAFPVDAERPHPAPIRPEDRALLEDLDLLLEWELMTEWDPGEDLPIPVEDPSSPPSAAPGPARDADSPSPAPPGTRPPAGETSTSGDRE